MYLDFKQLKKVYICVDHKYFYHTLFFYKTVGVIKTIIKALDRTFQA